MTPAGPPGPGYSPKGNPSRLPKPTNPKPTNQRPAVSSGSADFGDDNFEDVTVDQVIDYLRSQVCSEDEPHVSDITGDHGHTHCYFIGQAIRRLRALP